MAANTHEVLNPAEVAHREHAAACRVCSTSGETGRYCEQGSELYRELLASRGAGVAPIVTVDRYGRRSGHWSALSALAEVGRNGGEIVKAPAGVIEAGRAFQARELEEARARRAARRASGAARVRPPRRY
jgi:hypothetical protein